MKLLTKILPLALVVTVLAGCVKDNTGSVLEVQDGEVAFRVIVPGMHTPSSRALDADKEKEVTAIDVVIFNNVGNTLLEHHRVGASEIGDGTDGNDYQFKVKGIENPENITLAVIANAPDETAAALAAVTTAGTYVGAAKTAFLLALRAGTSAKWSTSAGGYRTIPMYGEVSVSGNILDAVTHPVNLTRMLAKVDVVNGVAPTGTPSDGKFELTAVHVVNRNTSGLIAPKWNAATGAPEPAPATTANLPAGFSPGTMTWASGNELTYMLSTGQTSLESEIYLFESSALSDNPATPNGLRLVFEGNYTSGGMMKHYYYPVDFTTPAGAYMPVLRNHRYLFTIAEAAGRGYDGLSEAVAAFGVMSNLRTSLVVVDESGIRHMVWNGEHFLGVNEKAFTVAAAGQQNVALQVSTNYAGGWRASVENAAANPWLTLGAASGQITDKTLTFNAVAVTGDAWTIRSGAILLTAGRLETRLTVSQGDYKIVAEPANTYVLDGVTQYNFKIKSNTQWAVRTVDDPYNILLNSATQIAEMRTRTDGNNTTTGDDFTFTLVNDTDGSLSGKTFTVTFYDPTGKAADITVTVSAVACGCNGTALALRVGTNGYTNNPGAAGVATYLTHIYGGKCWMVQNSKEGTASGTTYTGHAAGELGYYYSWAQAAQSTGNSKPCPDGWHLPTPTEFTTLMDEVNADLTGKGKWWAGSQGAANGAFAGYYSTSPTVWRWWGSYGYWWSSVSNQGGSGYTGGMISSGDLTVAWWSVRCVMD